MKTRLMFITLITCLIVTATIYAGTGVYMKCQEEKAKESESSTPCEYESLVEFGGGEFFEQATGYCRSCKKFVYLRWMRKDIPAELKMRIRLKEMPRPKPLGEVWDSHTGKVMTIHACPTCKGPFLEIKKIDDLKFCPACNKPHFAIDKNKPMVAYD